MAKNLATIDESQIPASTAPVAASTTKQVTLPSFTCEEKTVRYMRVFFSDGKPSAQVREYLKSFGMRFNTGDVESQGRPFWYGDASALVGSPFIS